MHPCAALLNELLECAKLEFNALHDEDIDRAEELAEKRAELLRKAWDSRDGYSEDQLIAQLQEVEVQQEKLQEKATAMHTSYCQQNSNTRKQRKYFGDYQHRERESQKAYYCHKVS